MDLGQFSAVRLFHDFGRVSTIANKMAARGGRGGVFIWSKLDQNLSEMDVRTFAWIKKVI